MEILKNNLTNRMILIISILFLLSIAISTVSASETNITSNDNLGQTVQNASNGDTINLNTGTYTNNVTNIIIDKNLTLKGNGLSNKVVIDAQNLGRIFTISAGNRLTLINITLTNGIATDGGAIYNNGGSLTITNTIFTNNNAFDEGGAIFNLNGNDLDISNSIFDNNNAAITGGAIANINVKNMTIYNSLFTNNTAPFGAAISTENGQNTTILDSNFTNNIANNIFSARGSILDIQENNSFIQGCNIYNNNQGINTSSAIIIEPNSNITINYNRIFNNTGYDINKFTGGNTNIDYNWWGNNTLDMTKIIGIIPNNYFVMNVTSLTSTVTNGSAKFNYTFGLNTSAIFDPSLLPFFVTNVYTNVTSGVQETFDARFNRTVSVDTDKGGQNVTYTFVTDNEVKSISLFVEPTPTNLEVNNPKGKNGKTVNLTAKLTDEDGNPIAGKLIMFHVAGMTLIAITDVNGIATVQYTINKDDFTDGILSFTATFEGDDNYLASIDTGIITLIEEPESPIPPEPEEANENNELAVAKMKETGIPIIAILIVLLSSLGLFYRKK